MKRFLLILLCVLCITLSGCRTAMDVSKAVAEKYQTTIQATVQVSAIAGIMCDYQLKCIADEETSTVEILQPEGLVGIKAIIESASCQIQYEELTLDSLMIPMRGMTPADCFDQTIYSLRKEVPVKYSYESKNGIECLCLTFEREEGNFTSSRMFWLREDTLELLEGEYYLDGTLVMKMIVKEIAFTNSTIAE